jgi:hypothetical protein
VSGAGDLVELAQVEWHSADAFEGAQC